jgi:hypothetical protein
MLARPFAGANVQRVRIPFVRTRLLHEGLRTTFLAMHLRDCHYPRLTAKEGGQLLTKTHDGTREPVSFRSSHARTAR